MKISKLKLFSILLASLVAVLVSSLLFLRMYCQDKPCNANRFAWKRVSSQRSNTSKWHRPQAFVESLKDSPEPGKQVYDAFCAACHASDPVISIGAPRAHILSDWQTRLKQRGKNGLLQNTLLGKQQMPARGGCFECSDELLNQAIIFMLLPT